VRERIFGKMRMAELWPWRFLYGWEGRTMIASKNRLPAIGLLLSALLCEPAWSMGTTLTTEQLSRLLKVVDTRGSRATVPASVAAMLDLKPDQLSPDIKQAAYLDDQGNRHGFAPLNDQSGFFMFRSGASLGQSVYRVDATLHLVRAARSLVKNGPLLALPEAEAQKELDEEFARWSKLLSPNGPAVKPPPGFPFKQPEPAKP
jgi:hypothetical protein